MQTETVPYNRCPPSPSHLFDNLPRKGEIRNCPIIVQQKGSKDDILSGWYILCGECSLNKGKNLSFDLLFLILAPSSSSKLLSSSPFLFLAVVTTLIRENDYHPLESYSFSDYLCLKFLRCLVYWIIDCSFSCIHHLPKLISSVDYPSDFLLPFSYYFSSFSFFILSTSPTQDFITLISISLSLAKNSHPLLSLPC